MISSSLETESSTSLRFRNQWGLRFLHSKSLLNRSRPEVLPIHRFYSVSTRDISPPFEPESYTSSRFRNQCRVRFLHPKSFWIRLRLEFIPIPRFYSVSMRVSHNPVIFWASYYTCPNGEQYSSFIKRGNVKCWTNIIWTKGLCWRKRFSLNSPFSLTLKDSFWQ